MDSIVVIIFIIAVLVGFTAYLTFEFIIMRYNLKLKDEFNLYKDKSKNVQFALEDLVNIINVKLPNSTLKCKFDGSGVSVSGEIKM